MTDFPRRDDGEPTRRIGNNHPGYTDPAYASQAPYGGGYQPPAPTERLPAYSPYGPDPYATGQYGYGAPPPGGQPPPPPPQGPKSPRWLWIVAAIAVLVVVGLVIALVIVNSSRQQTVVAPIPPLSEPEVTTTTPSTAPTTTSRTPVPTTAPSTTTTTTPPTTTTTPSSGNQAVTYDVDGSGRAISITYLDTGGVLQTEFNVVLPWSKQVVLPAPATGASVSIINVGNEVSCSVTVDGDVVQQRTGSGLTICVSTG
jgi:hypothetical protein